MGSSRKRQKELTRLKGSASTVWNEQQVVLDHATNVLREARRQLGSYAREEAGPRAKGAYNSRVKPVVARGVATGRAAADTGRTRLADDVIPAVSGALGSTLAVLQSSRDPRVREAISKAGKATKKLSKTASKKVAPAKSHGGVGRTLILIFGATAAIAVAYAAWQTLRADDELWIEDVADVDPGTPEA